MSGAVVEKTFIWRFLDNVTQGVKQARQALFEGEETAKKVSSSVSSSSENWKKAGDSAKEAAQKTSQSLDGMKEKVLSYQQTATNASKDIRSQLSESKQVLNGIPKQKVTNFKIKVDDNKLKSFSERIKGLPPLKQVKLNLQGNYLAQLEKFKKSANEAKTSFSRLKDITLGTMFGNAALSGIYAVGNGIKGLIASGDQYNRQQQTMTASWKTLTGSASEGKKLVDMTNQLAISAQNSTEMVNGLNQKFYAVTNNADKTKELSQSVLTLQDAFGASDAAIENFSTQWSQMVGNGKASAQDMLSIQNVFPKFRQKLLEYERDVTHNSKLTMKEMNDMISNGDISADAMNTVLVKMGNKYQDATKNFTGTLDGMGRIIKTTASRLAGSFVEPFTTVKNPLYKAVSNWVSDPRTMKAFQNAGKNIAGAFNDALTAVTNLHKAFEPLNRILGSILSGLASGVWKGFSSTLGLIADAVETVVNWISKLIGLIPGISKNNGALKATHGIFKDIGVIVGILLGSVTALRAAFMAFAAVKGVIEAVKGAVTALNTAIAFNPIAAIAIAVTALVVGLALLYKKWKPFHDIVNKTGEAIKKFFTGKYDWEKSFGKGLSKLVKSFQNFAKKIPQFFKGVGKAIVKAIVIGLALPVGIGVLLIKPLIKPLQNGTKSLIKTVQKQWKSFSTWLGKLFDPIAKLWQRVWNGWTRIFKTVWKGLKNVASSGMKAIQKLIGPAVKAIQKVWTSYWNAIFKFYSKIWNNITTFGGNSMKALANAISGPLKTIQDIWTSVWNGISNFFKDIWNGIKQAAQDGMNGVISVINAGIKAINSVWSFFTGHGTGVKELSKVHFAQGGTVRRHLSVINDGDGADWKELVQTPDGGLFMSNERNWTGFLPEGSRVYSGQETKQIMNAIGVSHYATGGIVGAQKFADGGIIGDGIEWAKGKLEDVGSWLGDKFVALIKFLENPLKATKGLLDKATSGMYKGLGNFADIAHGAIDKLTTPISEWFRKGLEKLESQLAGGTVSADLIRLAAAKMHVSVSAGDVAHIMNVIQHESGGRANAVNNWDVNAKNGDPSKGILQYISSTFRKYAVAGHGNIYSPYDQLLALFNDTTWRSDLKLGGWGPTGARRFANGGEVFGFTRAIIGDNPEGHELVLNPYAVSAEPLLDRAFQATAEAQPAKAGADNGTSKMDQMISLLSQLLNTVEGKDFDVYLDGEPINKNNEKRNAKAWALRNA